uniref:VLIG-type G domain-containing protein n=1 Tax=Globisporangium ultimum (strain ATCC 200006 / CBS 805.95 / DAOM BR144) TaxID=431595 RepID=K3WN04_GLOUD
MKRSDYRAALEQYQFKDSKPNRERIDDTVEAWNLAVLGMDHLWRELSHLYAADLNNRSHLADMAAQHLLDGFSLELMDGDAAMVNMKWIQGVLNALDAKLPNAKVQILSVMGVQSSGKSTLLNYMFGVRLRTSVSRCTRGVSMQLLKCEDRDKYDYIILMDTEGVRAPEYVGRDDSVWRDNRMATLAVLPADATIVLTKGESTDTINEILPIVLSVHLDSELAYQHGGRLPSKLFFTFNQIDLAERSKMENIVHMLVRQLNTNAGIVEETRRRALSGIS